MKDKGASPVIIGGLVLDIHATPSIPPNPGTTTPGKVHYTLGGVARNIAECISKLGSNPFLISAVGPDLAGNMLLDHCKSAGLCVKGIKREKNIETAVICNVFDDKGELAAAVASVESIERFLLPEWIQRFKHAICSAPILLVDANLSQPSLHASCQLAAEYDIPVWFEPVSVPKSKRVAPVIKHITFASPNEDELIAMANALSAGDHFHPIPRDSNGFKLSTESLFEMLRPAIWVLLGNGIKVVVVTLGSAGAFLCYNGGLDFKINNCKRNDSAFSRQLYEFVNRTCPPNRFPSGSECKRQSNIFAMHIPALPASVVRLTGAGDCLVAGTMASLCAGLDVLQSVAVGIAAAKAAVEAEANVPEVYNLAKLADDARFAYFDAKVIFRQSML